MASLGMTFDPLTVARPTWIGELQTYDQWVAWKKVPDPPRPKPKKLPIEPRTGRAASSTDSKTWGSYDDAVACAERRRLAGVGFVVTADDEFIGIDLDACRNAETGEISPWAQTILAFGETYAEVSPSGTGIRMIARGDPMPAAKSNAAGVEIYFDKRYLTITQDHIEGSPLYINPAPRTLATLLARIEEFRKPQDAPDDRQALSQRAPSQSVPGGSADDFFTTVKRLALQNLGAWVPALFGPRARQQSGTGAYRVSSKALGRNLEEDLSIAPNGIVDFGVADMGDPREGKRTAIDIVMEYGDEPDALAAAKWLCERMGVDPESLGALPERIEPTVFLNPQPRATIVSGGVVADAETGEVIEDAAPAPSGGPGVRFRLTRFDEIPYSIDDDDLVEGLLPSTGVAVIWGAPKSGKSFWALDLSMHIALGWKYRDLNVECGVVVYVALEGQSGFRRRVEGFCREKLGGKRDHDALFYLVETPLKLVKDQKKLVNDIRAQLGDLRPSAIFFDTFFRAFEGSEIDASDMEKNLAACDAIKLAFGCLVALIHHSGWDGERMRGHSSLFGGVDAVISVKKDGQNVVAKLEDAKDIASGAEIASRLVDVEIGTNKYGKPVTTLVVADAADPVEIKIDEEAQEKELASEQRLLRAMLNKPNGATREWGEMADMSKGGVDRALERLRKLKLVEKPFTKWRLTKAGEREAKLLDGVDNG